MADGKNLDIIEHATSVGCPLNLFDPGAILPPARLEPIPHDRWPLWAKAVEALRSADDIGVGSTIKRQLGVMGALFTATMTAVGLPCGCADRAAQYDIQYRY